MRLGDTPVPIPNTTVKTCTADGTMLETAWESRWPPEQKKKCSTVEGRKGRDTQVPTHLENRIYDNLAEHERKPKGGNLCTRRIGSRRSKKLRRKTSIEALSLR